MAVKSIVKVSELEGAKRLDAEYYQPKYLRAKDILKRRRAIQLGELLSDISYGIYTEPNYVDEGTDFIRALNLQEYSIEGKVLKVRPAVIPSQRYLLKAGDILIVRSGANVGNVGIIVERFTGATFGSYTIRLRLKDIINPYYVYILFKTKFGRLQTIRFRTGLAQPNINIPNLKLLEIVNQVPDTEQKRIEHLVRTSDQATLESETRYLQAEQMILDELRWDKLDLSQPKSYAVALSQANKVNRMDAEHFQPKYDRLLQHIAKRGNTDYLGNLVTQPIKRGLQPTYVEQGEVIVINSQHLGRYLLNIEATERTDDTFWKSNKYCQVRKNDVLLYSTGAYVGRANAWFGDQRAIASNHVTIIRPNATCNPLYLSVYLNALPGLMQAERWASGSGQREIYPEDTARFVIQLPSMEFQQHIADLVTQSWHARQKATNLLEEAKKRVEDMIEGAVSG